MIPNRLDPQIPKKPDAQASRSTFPVGGAPGRAPHAPDVVRPSREQTKNPSSGPGEPKPWKRARHHPQSQEPQPPAGDDRRPGPSRPARMLPEHVAEDLGFHVADIPVLVRYGFLTPLGKPTRQTPKRFARVVIRALEHDVEWLDQATLCLQAYWRNKKRFTDDEEEIL
jgi:hypothetical protein